ncbi:MAG TPA: diguanylate cyclase [Clostridiaceae bacterium]|jgi:oligopeptide transport system permease protein|nr:diguanylate cyclase [Clostridiaceae bacterium]HBF77048.1 diguanylate cyclase [Clostridiaceae bacterium]HBG39460.1 diguanylate cyclase [Clostridiaceae bacterium]HBX47492.1 diguanylate cyclase [Clostridiaceae bacterium]HCL50773.1 diguanylate cyclase [Clostridiaceae bacterium]
MEAKLDKNCFEPLKAEKNGENEIVKPSETYWQDAWRRLKENKVAMVSLCVLIFLVVLCIVGPMVSKYDYYTNDLTKGYLKPSKEHYFGTDNLGRDLYVRVLTGTRISFSVGIVAAAINFIIGCLYGGIAGFYGGMTDNIMMRIVDIIYSIPTELYVILLMVALKDKSGNGLLNIYIALGISYWTGMARIVRGQILTLKQQEFILAAKSLGAKNSRLIIKHLIPNCMGPIIVTLTMSIPSAIFTESFLSFIGLGVNAPIASLGSLCSDSLQYYRQYPYTLFFPALMLCIMMLAFNLFGDGLRDALDPKMRK